ncbi:addiction module protein [Rugamonas sp. DEMB1]|jgi:putative addiction module component (TIGR02574 family)|uniref:addiction module protein n=1 Tax=Rugamonas sp. DEMB1 TaxID=3039386 RepID=UPI00244B6587|nr:addiction module protein [Rugamonas sp. DEMB1]WGG49551.1 addiction module protein [Rugamonas sp. DEMB1]
MEFELEKLAAEALKLSRRGRAELAQRLLASLDDEVDEVDEVDEAWAQEIERRIAELDAGTVKAVPLADALAQVRATLK